MNKFKFLYLILILSITTLFGQQRVIHTFVALCGGPCQFVSCGSNGLGDGNSPRTNLYWGAMYGVRTRFRQNPDWQQVLISKNINKDIVERLVFKHRSEDVYLVADAYRGCAIKTAIKDFFAASSGRKKESIKLNIDNNEMIIKVSGGADLIVYVGHDGLMDFNIDKYPESIAGNKRESVILSCKSSEYFKEGIISSGAYPLLWTKQFMAPEAYILEAVLLGWIIKETNIEIQHRAAVAYAKYQKISVNSALTVFKAGW